MRLSPLLLLVALTSAATAEPVKNVATLTQPLVVRLQQDGDRLQKTMALQRRAFELRATSLVGQEQAARAPSLLAERDWRLEGSKDVLAQLTVLREDDAALLADPIAVVAGPPAVAASKQPAVDLSALKPVITGLDRLKGKTRMSFVDLLEFAASTNSELEKLNASQPDVTAAAK